MQDCLSIMVLLIVDTALCINTVQQLFEIFKMTLNIMFGHRVSADVTGAFDDHMKISAATIADRTLQNIEERFARLQYHHIEDEDGQPYNQNCVAVTDRPQGNCKLRLRSNEA